MPVIVDAHDVTRIEVVAVALQQDPNWHAWTAVPGEVIGVWDAGAVEAVLGLVAALPDAVPARCFVPGYAIRIRGAEGVVAEVAFCFQCRNAKVLWPRATSDAALTWFTFDPESQPAQDLLRRFRALGGAAPRG
jgi:hypothetical protein